VLRRCRSGEDWDALEGEGSKLMIGPDGETVAGGLLGRVPRCHQSKWTCGPHQSKWPLLGRLPSSVTSQKDNPAPMLDTKPWVLAPLCSAEGTVSDECCLTLSELGVARYVQHHPMQTHFAVLACCSSLSAKTHFPILACCSFLSAKVHWCLCLCLRPALKEL